ncbi:MAG: LptF/LptG family permease [Thermoanaerobaculia bacterium]|nr:LptF/LptG family permease [Thermoanaerobaculia bacterium]MBP9822731.1 LptF/LptG family permease [Thermoanaerobaculia bacterium]
MRPLFARLDRYVLREIIGPLGLGFLVYTFILLLQFLFASAEMIIRRGLPAPIVGQLVLYSLPNIVVLTIPMSLLLGVLVGVGRLASDSELVALRSTGMSIYRLLRPVLALSALLTVVNGLLMVYLLPQGNRAVSRLYLDILTRTVAQQVEPRVFYNEWQGKVLYIFEASARNEEWKGVFLADAVPSERQEVIVARRGKLLVEDEGERVVLQLADAIKHSFDFHSPKRYETSRHETLRIVLRDRFLSTEKARMASRRGPRELELAELRKLSRDISATPEQRRLARVGVHKMFAIPAACLVMGLISLPLGFTNRHGGRSSGFAISIGVIVAYYVLLSQGEDAARLGKLSPGFAIWLPDLLLLAIGLVLLGVRNRDRGILPRRLQRFLGAKWASVKRRRSAWSKRRTARPDEDRRPGLAATTVLSRGSGGTPASPNGVAGAGAHDATSAARPRRRVVLRLPRLRLRFPNILDRYVLRRLGEVLALVWISAIAISSIADLTGNIDDILKNQPPARIVLQYYKYQSLQTAYDIAPIAVLIATLITFSLLSRTSEVIALRSLGMSLHRVALPAVAGAAGVAMLCAFLQLQVLPASNQKVEEANNIIKGRTQPRSVRRADQQWLLGQGRFIYNYLNFDPKSSSLQRLQVFDFDEKHQLVARLLAANAQYTPKGWAVSDGWARTFEGLNERSFRSFTTPVAVDLEESPDYFEAEVRRPREMGFTELRAYVREVRESGQAVPALEVALQDRVAFPFASLVMSLVALPFAFRLERKGALYGLGLAIVLGIFFLAVFAFFRTLGQVGTFPAVIAAWSPNVLFALLSGYLFLGVKS